jgi:hypothetical protein
VEPLGGEALEATPFGVVGKVKVRLNANLRSLTLEELRNKKKDMHLASFRNLIADTVHELERIAQESRERNSGWKREWQGLDYTIPEMLSHLKLEGETVLARHERVPATQYAIDAVFRNLVTEMLDVNSSALSTLRFFLVSGLEGSCGTSRDFSQGLGYRLGEILALIAS